MMKSLTFVLLACGVAHAQDELPAVPDELPALPVEPAPPEQAPPEPAPPEPAPPVEPAPAEAPADAAPILVNQRLACGADEQVFTNGRSTPLSATVSLTCDCGPGAYAQIALWKGGAVQSYPCKAPPGPGQCAVEVPPGFALGVECENADVPADQRKQGGCSFVGTFAP